MAQVQEQVQEMIFCCVLLSLCSSNLHSYSNLLIATDFWIKPCKCIYKLFMSKWWQTCTYIFPFWLWMKCCHANGVYVHLIPIYFVYRYQITIAHKAVMLVEKNRWKSIFISLNSICHYQMIICHWHDWYTEIV